jgi:hypothetical protein
MRNLEAPDSPDVLYRYRGSEIPRSRPIFQGDVFEDVIVPCFDDSPTLALIITHACSLRAGTELRSRLLMGIVELSNIKFSWNGNFRMMALPNLLEDPRERQFVVEFDNIGSVMTQSLDLDKRVACLSDLGVLILQQRLAHHFTRSVIETDTLFDQCANVLTEAELLEDWVEASIKFDNNWDDKYKLTLNQFEDFIKDKRDLLKYPSKRSEVRRVVHHEINRRFGNLL